MPLKVTTGGPPYSGRASSGSMIGMPSRIGNAKPAASEMSSPPALS